jgi:hypothetical protein
MEQRASLGRAVLATILVVGVAACGGRGAGAPSIDATRVTQPAPATLGTDVPGSPTDTPTPAASLDLPDLSAVQTDLDTIDGALASDAAAASDEGSDK